MNIPRVIAANGLLDMVSDEFLTVNWEEFTASSYQAQLTHANGQIFHIKVEQRSAAPDLRLPESKL